MSVIDDLERRALVQRRRDERDRRRSAVTITEAGSKVLRGRLASLPKLNDILLAPLTIDERAALLGLLRVYHAHNPDRVPASFVARLAAIRAGRP